jgi:hypothetical protein
MAQVNGIDMPAMEVCCVFTSRYLPVSIGWDSGVVGLKFIGLGDRAKSQFLGRTFSDPWQ